jgi:diguanylate cyclase
LKSNKRLQSDLLCTRYRLEEQAQEVDHARREARTDPLTGMANRKALNEKLHVTLNDWQRERQPFALMLIDLDRFKLINDAHGHPAGDFVLKKISSWLREWVREGDFVGRYGGDEFAVLLPGAQLSVGMDRAETIRRSVAERATQMRVHGEQISISLSIGVAAPRPSDHVESILQRADEALYKSKHRGRNQVHCQEPEHETVMA